MVAMIHKLRRFPEFLICIGLLAACGVPAVRSALGQVGAAASSAASSSDAKRFVDGLKIGPLPHAMSPTATQRPLFLRFEAPATVQYGSPRQFQASAPSAGSKPAVRLTPSLMRRIASTIPQRPAAVPASSPSIDAATQTPTADAPLVARPTPAEHAIPARLVSANDGLNTGSPAASATAPANAGARSQKVPTPVPLAESRFIHEAPVVEIRKSHDDGVLPHDVHLEALASGCPVRCGVMCGPCDPCHEVTWDAMAPIPWESLAHGEYIGPARLPHVPEYRLRVDDVIDFVFRLTRTPSVEPYRINVGDTLRIESLTSQNLNREVIVQPDGTITVGNVTQVNADQSMVTNDIGQVPAAGRTLEELRADLTDRYKPTVRVPSITVTPILMDSRLMELRATVDARSGFGGQSRRARVTPEGSVQLPALGSVPAQGLTLDELKFEIEQRYNEIVVGLEITPILFERAPRYIYVTGEVGQPGRYELVAPTTLMQAIALAGNWNVGADLENIVILRRDENWQLMATKVNLHYALFGQRPCPEGEIWLRDSDIVLLPKHPILWTDDLINLLFTRGLYGIFPISYQMVFTRATTL